jgi:hypothetical protein
MMSCARGIRSELEMKSARKKGNKLRMGKVLGGSEKNKDNDGNDESIARNHSANLDVVAA